MGESFSLGPHDIRFHPVYSTIPSRYIIHILAILLASLRSAQSRADNQTPNLVHYSTYSIPELLPAAQIMLDYILNPDFNAETVFHKKYASKKHMKSSIYVRHWALKNWPESADGTGEDRGRELWIDYEETYGPFGR